MHPDGYFALLLTPASADALAASATLPNRLAHHCTVCHGTRDPADLPPAFTPADVGRAFRLQVIGRAASAEVEAVVVALLDTDGARVERVFSRNAVPHVTVATDGVAEPFTANALLEAGYTRAEGPVLEAVLLHSHAFSAR